VNLPQSLAYCSERHSPDEKTFRFTQGINKPSQIVNRMSQVASFADATGCRLESSDVGGRRRAVLDAELLVNVVEVLADGRRFGVEDHGDLAAGLAARYPD